MGEQEKEAPCFLNGCTGGASIMERGYRTRRNCTL